MNRLTNRVRAAVLLAAAALQLAVVARSLPRGPDGFLPGDSYYYAAAAQSVWDDGDLDILNQCFPDAADLATVLPTLEAPGCQYFGWAAGGYLTTKQSPVFGLSAIPFYAAFGVWGFLLANLVVMNLLLAAVARLGGGGPGAWLAALVAFVTTPLVGFTYDFSPDLFLTALILGALLAARADHPVAAGLLAGLAVSVKLYAAVLLLPVLALTLWPSPGALTLLRIVAAGVVGLLPGLACNAVQFGAPWVSGYQRELLVRDGVLGLSGHASRFHEPPLEGLADLFTNPTVGLLQTAPLIVFVPVGVVVLARRGPVPGGRPALVAALATALLTLALFAPYEGRHSGSTVGNRFLFPVIACGFAVMGAAADRTVRARCAASASAITCAESANAR
jgi:hypothetical protein